MAVVRVCSMRSYTQHVRYTHPFHVHTYPLSRQTDACLSHHGQNWLRTSLGRVCFAFPLHEPVILACSPCKVDVGLSRVDCRNRLHAVYWTFVSVSRVRYMRLLPVPIRFVRTRANPFFHVNFKRICKMAVVHAFATASDSNVSVVRICVFQWPVTPCPLGKCISQTPSTNGRRRLHASSGHVWRVSLPGTRFPCTYSLHAPATRARYIFFFFSLRCQRSFHLLEIWSASVTRVCWTSLFCVSVTPFRGIISVARICYIHASVLLLRLPRQFDAFL